VVITYLLILIFYVVCFLLNVVSCRSDSKFDIRTKGDNNPSDDYYGGIYARGQKWLREGDLVGRAKALLPYVGYVTTLSSLL